MEFYYHDVQRDVLILKADGGIDSTNAEEVVADLSRLIETGIRKLVVDCAGVGTISSAGVGVLFRLHKQLWTLGGHVKLASVGGPVFHLLEVTNLAEVFEVYPSVEAALAAFAEST